MVIRTLLLMFGKEQTLFKKISALMLTQSYRTLTLRYLSLRGEGIFIILIRGVHTAISAQGTLEAVHDEQDFL